MRGTLKPVEYPDETRRLVRRQRLKAARRALGPRYEQPPDRKKTIDVLDQQIARLGRPGAPLAHE